MATSLRLLKQNMRMQAMNRCQNQKEPCINKESLEGHQNEKQSCIGNESLEQQNNMHSVMVNETPSSLRSLKWAIRKQACHNHQKQKESNKAKKATSTYLNLIQDTPIYACSLCTRLHFKKDIRAIDNEIMLAWKYLTTMDEATPFALQQQICRFCKKTISKGQLPKFASPIHI